MKRRTIVIEFSDLELNKLDELYNKTQCAENILHMMINLGLSEVHEDKYSKYWLEYIEIYTQYMSLADSFINRILSEYDVKLASCRYRYSIDFNNRVVYIYD